MRQRLQGGLQRVCAEWPADLKARRSGCMRVRQVLRIATGRVDHFERVRAAAGAAGTRRANDARRRGWLARVNRCSVRALQEAIPKDEREARGCKRNENAHDSPHKRGRAARSRGRCACGGGGGRRRGGGYNERRGRAKGSRQRCRARGLRERLRSSHNGRGKGNSGGAAACAQAALQRDRAHARHSEVNAHARGARGRRRRWSRGLQGAQDAWGAEQRRARCHIRDALHGHAWQRRATGRTQRRGNGVRKNADNARICKGSVRHTRK